MDTGQRAGCVPWHLQTPWLGQGLLLPRTLLRGGRTPHSRRRKAKGNVRLLGRRLARQHTRPQSKATVPPGRIGH